MPNSHVVTKQSQRFAPTPGYRLLVSVRDRDEAIAAIDGGSDILDVKEPNRGSLGMADVATIGSVIDAARFQSGCGKSISISAALGELADWLNADDIPQLPVGIDYVKLGLSRMRSVSCWQKDFERVQNRIVQMHEGAMATALRGHVMKDMPTQTCGHGTHPPSPHRQPRWIAVIYADQHLAESPKPEMVLQVASETDCSGILIDTFEKNGRTLLDWMGPDALQRITECAHDVSLTVAIAGSLSLNSLPQLDGIDADVIAVRSAVCHGSNRRGKVSRDAVHQFKSAMCSPRSNGISTP